MTRTPTQFDLPALGALDRSKGQLGRQLAKILRQAVLRGELKSGDRLPSTRLLARSLGVARGTVVEAFEQLISEGVLESLPGSGTRVCEVGPSPALPPEVEPGLPLPTPAVAYAALAEEFQPLPHAPFAISVPVGRAAPDDTWRRLSHRIRARGPGAPSGYSDPQGVLALREALAHYLRRSRAVHCTPEQIVITSGLQQALYVCTQLLFEAGDRVWVEDPAYRGLTAILEHAPSRLEIVRVPVDGEGIQVESGLRKAPDARAAFITPSHQYPLGVPMSLARRQAMLEWAKRSGSWIVEDDYDSEFRYAGHPFPSLQGSDPRRVIYLGTFSKVLFPSLRIGYAVLPPNLLAAFCGARALIDRHPPSADQHVLSAYIKEGHLDRHIRRVRSVYAQRQIELIGLLKQHLSPALGTVQPCDQGMHLVVWLAEGVDDRAIANAALRVGVGVRALSPLYAGDTARSGLILGLGDFESVRIEKAVRALCEVIHQVSGPARKLDAFRT